MDWDQEQWQFDGGDSIGGDASVFCDCGYADGVYAYCACVGSLDVHDFSPSMSPCGATDVDDEGNITNDCSDCEAGPNDDY